MTTTSTLLTALVAAGTALAVAVLTQFVTSRRERAARTYERRRAALLDAQDTALALRNRFGEFGAANRVEPATQPTLVSAAAQRRLDDALAALAVRLTRVDDAVAVQAANLWRERASYHSISGEEVSDAEEIDAWRAMNDAFGSALQSATGVSAAPARGSTGSS
jgi:hypothetical protein